MPQDFSFFHRSEKLVRHEHIGVLKIKYSNNFKDTIMAFEASQHQISFLLGKKIYSIPRNQRRYVWNTDNWKDLLEDLDFLQNSGKDHFFGSIVLNADPLLDKKR